MEFQGQAHQDEFVANLLKFKQNGFFLDVGSCHAVYSNNTCFFESIGWRGICIELNPEHNDSYKQRKCRFINDDATKVDYQALLEEENFPSSPDYFSVDVDEASLIVLKKMPLDKYRFKTITIEHDAYIHGNQYKDAQADILLTHGYRRLFNILVPYPCNDTKPNCPFEDWWICPDNFNVSEMDGIAGDSLYPKEAIGRVKAWAGR